MAPSLPSKPMFQLKNSSNSLFQGGKSARLARIAGAIIAIVVSLSLIFRFNGPHHYRPISRLSWTSSSKSGTYDPTKTYDSTKTGTLDATVKPTFYQEVSSQPPQDQDCRQCTWCAAHEAFRNPRGCRCILWPAS